ncbi:MAG: hypothetical protein KAJ19_11200 [Gammaproteobacteria bacterium]|nr:hypothetical protein [Gammaproteobacteria bacterium]
MILTPEQFFNEYFQLHPLSTDGRIPEYNNDTIAAGTVATITYTVPAGVDFFLTDIWIDVLPNSAFEIFINGTKYTSDNELDFSSMPLKLQANSTIVYKIYNNDASSQDYENKVIGFTRSV